MKFLGVSLLMGLGVLGSVIMSNTAVADDSSHNSQPASSSQQWPWQSGEWLPESGVAWHYSPLAVPTEMKPLSQSMASMLSRGYAIRTTNNYKNGLLFTLARGKNNVICVFNPPELGTDQNVPTSRCWALN